VKVEALFYPMIPDCQRSSAFWKVPRLRTFVLVRATCKRRWVWSTEVMIKTRENSKYLEKKLSQCHSVHHKSHRNWPGIETRPPRRGRRLTA